MAIVEIPEINIKQDVNQNMVYANKNLINLLNKFLNIYPLNFYKNILLYKKLI